MVGSDDEFSVKVRLDRKLWQQFKECCSARETKPSEVLFRSIETYVVPAAGRETIATPSPSDRPSDREILQIIEDYLQQNLEPKVVEILEHHLSPPSADRPPTGDRPPPSPPKTATPPQSAARPPEKPRSRPQNSNLKSAKELAQILGVSPPYITTLNRLGELPTRGWEDSGERRGKTILYRPISPSGERE